MGSMGNFCKRCKTELSHSDMRMDRDGKTIICPDCYDTAYGKKNEHTRMSELGKVNIEFTDDFDMPEHHDEPVSTLRYECTSCNFKFSRKRGFQFNNLCPYCGEKTVVIIGEKLKSDTVFEEFLKS